MSEHFEHWDRRFIELARHVSSWSKDPSKQVGAVIVDAQHRVVSLGFNGFPHGIRDDDRLHDRQTKYELVVHAEINAVLFAGKDLRGCTLYVWPIPPCSRCAAQIIQTGIIRVCSNRTLETDRWHESCSLARKMFEEAGVACDYRYPKDVWEDEKAELYDADPNCQHVLTNGSGGGVRCLKCKGWFCY